MNLIPFVFYNKNFMFDDVNIFIGWGIVWRQDKQRETGEKYITINFIITLRQMGLEWAEYG
jgi:hypothetical protein